MNAVHRLAAVLASLAFLASAGDARQQTPPSQTFRSSVDLVQVDVTVLDRNRLPVRGLTAPDFTVFEDGKPRPLTAFTPVQLRAAPAPPAKWMRDVAPDVVTNTIPQEGRLVVILMDRTIRATDMPYARKIASSAIDLLAAGDLAAVVYTLWGMPQNFTADRARLMAAINQPFVGMPEGDEGNPAECFCGVCTHETMTRIADSLRDVPHRRKTLLFVGRNFAVQSSGACGGDIREARTKLFRAAEVANLTIHAIDPSGLESLAPTAGQRGPRSYSAMGLLVRQGNLMSLADHTGGVAVLNTNAPQQRLGSVLGESSAYYVLGFEPANPRADGRFHEIKIKVNRPGTTVLARRGYYAPGASPPPPGFAPNASASVVEAATGLWPRNSVPLGVTAAAFALPGRTRGAAAIVLNVRQEEGGFARDVEVLTAAFDRWGRPVVSQQQTLSIRPPQSVSGDFEYEVLSRLALGPGRYEIRVALDDPDLRRSGSVYTYVDVPNFIKEPLSLSGIAVETTPRALAAPGMAFADLLPIAPVSRRRFASTDSVTAFLRAYQGQNRVLGGVTISARILDEANRIVFQETRLLRAGEFDADRTADYMLQIPLDRLGRGEHALTIEAMAGLTTVRRDLRFTIR
jgi:VWFA-related protein